MRKFSFIFLLFFLLILINNCTHDPLKRSGQRPQTTKDSVSYCLGTDVGEEILQNFKDQDLDLVIDDMFVEGFLDVLSGKGSDVTDETRQKVLTKYFRTKHRKKFQDWLEENKKFLEENKNKEDVVALPSGVQYKIIEQGTGRKPTMESEILVAYKGSFIDGRLFDSTYQGKGPQRVNMKDILTGWQIALQQMPEGSTWKIFVPYEMGYGEKGFEKKVPPYSTLIFEIELIEVF
jgi:FKBP-type peptidyl-prolyl cis-trans isomerase FklB